MFLEFGLTLDNDYIHVSEVESGACDVVCPFCKGELIAKKGKIKSHHFAHAQDTCAESLQVIQQIQIPTIDTFEYLDTSEKKYMDRRSRYDHSSIFSWKGMNQAIKRLNAMGLVEISRKESREILDAKSQLKELTSLFHADGSPKPEFYAVLEALEPICKAKSKWKRGETVDVKISRDYFKHEIRHPESTSLNALSKSQLFWMDAFRKRQEAFFPECLEMLDLKMKYIDSQNLYLMQFTNGTEIIHKIGVTTKSATQRLKEVERMIKSYGFYDGQVLCVVPNMGRVERLAHRHYKTQHYKLGRFQEFFSFKDINAVEGVLKSL